MMLASPLLPSSPFSNQHHEDAGQYRPAKDIEAFNGLLPPPIEFVEGSSTGMLALVDAKYEPINGTPKAAKASLPPTPSAPTPMAEKPTHQRPTANGKAASLYPGALDITWPNNVNIGSGLHNTGNSCFANSALQCLLHTPPLLRVLLAHSQTDPCRVKSGVFCMSCTLRAVMVESHSTKRAFTPSSITNKMHLIAKHMRRGRQEDSHEFLRYLIDALQKSCLAGYPPKIDPKLAETTWVHKMFGGRLRSRVTCRECGYNSDTFDRILDLSVDIHGANTLKEALKKFVAVDVLKGEDKYKCEKCKKHVVAQKQFTIHEAPMVLTIHLKRFSPLGRKIGHLLRYEQRLTLDPFMSDGEFGPSYVLQAVISHAGGGPNSGHYYAHVRAANGQWYEMNDDMVSRSQGAPTSMKSAYVLFYMRDKGQALGAAVGTLGGGGPRQAASSTSSPAVLGADRAPLMVPPTLMRTGLAAGMKKRRIVESDDEDEDTGVKAPRGKTLTPVRAGTAPATPPKRFIGPMLPPGFKRTDKDPASPVAVPAVAAAPDPQATKLQRKIQAMGAAKAAKAQEVKQSEALAILAQYSDSESGSDSDDPMDGTGVAPSSTPAAPPDSSPVVTRSSPAPAPAADPVPATSFYGSAGVKSNGTGGGRKRKSPDADDDAMSTGENDDGERRGRDKRRSADAGEELGTDAEADDDDTRSPSRDARRPLAPLPRSPGSASPGKRRRQHLVGRRSFGGGGGGGAGHHDGQGRHRSGGYSGNPYNRLSGGNNLHARKEDVHSPRKQRPMQQYGKRGRRARH